jgi:hypothetical protein
MQDVLDTILCDKVLSDQWFSLGTLPAITLLKVEQNTLTLLKVFFFVTTKPFEKNLGWNAPCIVP